MVSGIFSIPLEAHHSRSNETRCEVASRRRMLREYIGSDENRLVQFAVQSLLERSPKYNPLVLHGPTGTGKSFLALGLAERWRETYPKHRVVVTCGADFARSYANAVDTDNLATFRKKSRSANLFVLDDVHLMQTKRAAQGELSRLIDALLDAGTVVLITGSKPPSGDDGLQPGLRSRLAGGLPVPLTAPGAPARRLLVRRLAEIHEVNLSHAAIELLAGGSSQDELQQWTVPRLNHAVMQLAHATELEKSVVGAEQVRCFLEDQASEQQPTLRLITAKVGKYFSLTGRELRGPSRRRNVVRARGVAMLLARNLTGQSLESVGRYFGNRDHTTALHACRKTEALQHTDPAISRAMEELICQLKVT